VTGQPVPRQEKFEVTGIFETGMYEYDNAYVFMSLPNAQRFAQLGEAVTGVEVRTESREAAPRIALALLDSLRFPYRTEDWHAQNASFFKALQLQKVGMALVLLLIVLVAAFNVVSTLTMVVNEKRREIGILRAMGMRARSIGRIFFAQGIMIGIVGTALGALLGLAASVALGHYKLISLDPSVYVIDHLPVATDVGDVTLILLACLLITALATLYPAQQAARAYPVDAIRQE
jgi:lipoprotein-releasing system permease protein